MFRFIRQVFTQCFPYLFFLVRGHSTTMWTKVRILPFFDTHLHPAWTDFLHPEHGQKQTFFYPNPPSSYLRSYWMAPYLIENFETWHYKMLHRANSCSSSALSLSAVTWLPDNCWYRVKYYFSDRVYLDKTLLILYQSTLGLSFLLSLLSIFTMGSKLFWSRI